MSCCLTIVGAVCGHCKPATDEISGCFIKAMSDSFRQSSSYLVKLRENLEKLPRALSELTNLRQTVMGWVKKKEKDGDMRRKEGVEQWFKKEEELRKEVKELVNQGEPKCLKLCLLDVCSTEFIPTVAFAKSVHGCLEELEKTKSAGKEYEEGNVAVPFFPGPKQKFSRSGEYTYVGLEARLAEILIEIKQHSIVGVIGTVGVGKTTLLEKVRDHYHRIDDLQVIWIGQVTKWEVDDVQEKIRKQIDLLQDWNLETPAEKASHISEALQKKRFILLIDGVTQSSIDLHAVGVPYKDQLKTNSKVVFATRRRDVCREVKPQPSKILKVENLKDCRDALRLLRIVAGMDADSKTNFDDCAVQVAKKCGGLPYALIKIGKAMKSMDRKAWRGTIDFLGSPESDPDRADQLFRGLKSAYEDLPDTNHKTCFLYCAFFPEETGVPKNQLKETWIFGDFWSKDDNYPFACEKAHNILVHLIGAGLLEEEHDEHVKMQPMLRLMALWLLAKEDTLVLTGTESQKLAGFKRLFIENDVEDLPKVNKSEFRHLKTLLLTGTGDLCKRVSGFFEHMKKLTVLNLSSSSVQELPKDVKHLIALEYLDISHTKITQLRAELKGLAKLKYFNVNGLELEFKTTKDVISKLSCLRVLKMICKYRPPEVEGDEDDLLMKLKGLQYLKVLEIALGSEPPLKNLFLLTKLLKSTQHLGLRNFKSSREGVNVSLSKDTEKLEELSIIDCHFKELDVHFSTGKGTVSAVPLPETLCNITRVSVQKCDSLLDLTCLVLLPNLHSLKVEDCSKLKEIISAGKLKEMEGKYKDIKEAKEIALSNLLVLILKDLPELQSICSKSTIIMNSSCVPQKENCPKLRS